MIENLKYLVAKYLVELALHDTDSTKYILSEISKYKKKEYDKEDANLIKDISFFYL